MVFATFEVENKEYRYTFINGKICYSYQKHGKICTNLTMEEREMMDNALAKIIISKSTRHLKDDMYLTNQINSIILANQKEGENVTKLTQQKFKVPIKVKKGLTTVGLIVEVTVAVMCLLKTFPGIPYFYDSYQSQQYNLPYSATWIEEALHKNKNLSEEEKEFVYSHLDILEENKEYIDMAAVIYNMQNLHIEYSKEPDQICIEKNASGYFQYYGSKIFIAGGSSFAEVVSNPLLKTTLSHEIGHAFTPASSGLGTGLIEAINETLKYEYSEEYCSKLNTYASQRICLYAFCEIICTDSLKYLHFRKDITPLINDLTTLIEDEEMAYQLIHEIDMLEINGTFIDNAEELRASIYKKIGTYFNAKYGYDITQDEIMMAYFSSSGFVNIDDHIQLSYLGEPYLYEFRVPKGYFSNSYIKKYPNIICCIYEKAEESEGDILYFPIDIVEVTSSGRSQHKVKIKIDK